MSDHVYLTRAEAQALSDTFGSWDWSPGKYSGTDRCRAISFSPSTTFVDVSYWDRETVELFKTMTLATIKKPDHSHGCKTQFRKWPRKRVRERLARRLNEVYLAAGISLIDMLADLAEGQ